MSQIVDPKLALDCMANYQKLYTGDDMASIQKAFSASVSFSYATINEFMAAAAARTNTLQICFGVYTAEFAKAYNVQEGRLTVFLCTVDGGYGGIGDPPHDLVMNIGNTQP